MQVKDIMSKKPDYLPPNTTLQKASEEMLKYDVGFLPIGNDGQLFGAITDRDIVVRALAKGKDPLKMQVQDIMTPNILSCFEDDDVQKAAKTMSDEQIRRLVVLSRDNKISGVISLGDIAVKTKNDQLTGHILQEVCEK